MEATALVRHAGLNVLGDGVFLWGGILVMVAHSLLSHVRYGDGVFLWGGILVFFVAYSLLSHISYGDDVLLWGGILVMVAYSLL